MVSLSLRLVHTFAKHFPLPPSDKARTRSAIASASVSQLYKTVWVSPAPGLTDFILRRSRAYTKSQCMDFRVAQRSMIRTKQSMYISTHTPYILQKAHAHHIFYMRGDTAQNVPMRTYTPQSSIANTTCKVRAPHLLQLLLRFLCSCAEAGHMQISGHGLTSCAAIDESRKVEYTHRQYSLQNTLNRNCNLCNER
jgi:hypothetical protein